MLEDYGNWVRIVGSLTASPGSAREYRRTRAAVASVIARNICNAAGLVTTSRTSGGAAVTPVIYGIWLDKHSSNSPLYVGQTMDAERRLWDLPLGESHHLANTYPPEIWQRVVVVRAFLKSYGKLPFRVACGSAGSKDTVRIDHIVSHRLQDQFSAVQE